MTGLAATTQRAEGTYPFLSIRFLLGKARIISLNTGSRTTFAASPSAASIEIKLMEANA